MRYTIITPTICRPSLRRLCDTVDAQTHADWEHLVVVDLPSEKVRRTQRDILCSVPKHNNRILLHCERQHKNYGHTCRHQAWAHARGEYILYVDDDDYLADNDVLRTLDSVTEAWAVFPMLRHGKSWLNLPPGMGKTSTGCFIHRKNIGRWPDSDLYEADGLFVEELAIKYQCQVLESRPLVVQPQSSCGVSDATTWFGNMLAKLTYHCLRVRRAYNS